MMKYWILCFYGLPLLFPSQEDCREDLETICRRDRAWRSILICWTRNRFDSNCSSWSVLTGYWGDCKCLDVLVELKCCRENWRPCDSKFGFWWNCGSKLEFRGDNSRGCCCSIWRRCSCSCCSGRFCCDDGFSCGFRIKFYLNISRGSCFNTVCCCWDLYKRLDCCSTCCTRISIAGTILLC